MNMLAKILKILSGGAFSADFGMNTFICKAHHIPSLEHSVSLDLVDKHFRVLGGITVSSSADRADQNFLLLFGKGLLWHAWGVPLVSKVFMLDAQSSSIRRPPRGPDATPRSY